MPTRLYHFNDALSARERTVLDRIVAGDQTKQIARLLSISPKTVDSHRTNIRVKLGARNTADIVRIAMTMKAQPQSDQVMR